MGAKHVLRPYCIQIAAMLLSTMLSTTRMPMTMTILSLRVRLGR